MLCQGYFTSVPMLFSLFSFGGKRWSTWHLYKLLSFQALTLWTHISLCHRKKWNWADQVRAIKLHHHFTVIKIVTLEVLCPYGTVVLSALIFCFTSLFWVFLFQFLSLSLFYHLSLSLCVISDENLQQYADDTPLRTSIRTRSRWHLGGVKVLIAHGECCRAR